MIASEKRRNCKRKDFARSFSTCASMGAAAFTMRLARRRAPRPGGVLWRTRDARNQVKEFAADRDCLVPGLAGGGPGQ